VRTPQSLDYNAIVTINFLSRV